jgi:uncharacterized LabA/DUF88 family protein
MPGKVCVFVDGENFRHAIVELFSDVFNRDDYLPKNADWAALFDWIVSEATKGSGGERLRTYWYVSESISYFPYKFPGADHETEKLKKVLCKDPELERELRSLRGNELIEKMKKVVEALQERRKKMQNRFNGWRDIQGSISSRCRAVEFRRAGAIPYNLFTNKFDREKAVDVKLATDLIVLRDIYDVAIIVSGDQDYVPAVEVVKDSGKSVVNIAFLKRSGTLLPGGARLLNQATDWSCSIPYDDLLTRLNLKPEQA